jgi:hypothetical protein
MRELAEAIQSAKDNLTRVSGDHYGLAYILRSQGVKPASDRREIIKQAEALLDCLTSSAV